MNSWQLRDYTHKYPEWYQYEDMLKSKLTKRERIDTKELLSTIIEALYYILKKLKKADKIKLVKLIYLADKYHLIRYGRTITNDDYYAMEHGPVGTTVKDVLSFDTFNIPSKTFKYLSTLIVKVDENHFRVNPDAKVTIDML